MQVVYLLQEFSGLIICILAGAVLYRRLEIELQILWLLAVLCLESNIVAYWIDEYQEFFREERNNHFIYNVYMILDLGVLFIVSASLLKQWLLKGHIFIIVLPFILVTIFQFWYTGITTFANLA